MQPVVGYNFGARHFERVQKTLKKVIRIAVTIMGLGWVCSELLPRHIVAMFSDDAELNKLAEVGLRITILSFPMVGAQIVITNFFQSIGKDKISILLSLARQLLFLIPLLLYAAPYGRFGYLRSLGKYAASRYIGFYSCYSDITLVSEENPWPADDSLIAG